MGGPPGMAQGSGTPGSRASSVVKQAQHATNGFAEKEATLRFKHRYTRAVVASILQPAEAFNYNGPSRPVSYVTDDAAHNWPSHCPGRSCERSK